MLTLTSCNNNDEYKRVLSSFFGTVKQKGITNIAVDLRENGGGNSSVANEFLTYVDVDCYSSWESESRYGPLLIRCCNGNIVNEKKSNAFSGNLYVLTATETFSSAMDFAMLVGDNNIGTLVGEASGNIPDGYGDCLTFQMPESGLVMSVSYKRWYRIDQSKTGELITPDYAVEGSAALEKVYELISV